MPGSITSECVNSVSHMLILSLALPTPPHPPHPTQPPTSCIDQKFQTFPWLRTIESQPSVSSELQPRLARALFKGSISGSRARLSLQIFSLAGGMLFTHHLPDSPVHTSSSTQPCFLHTQEQGVAQRIPF